MLVDRFGRKITNLRIAITNKCNLKCVYCHREGELSPGEEMNLEEIRKISNAFYRLGIKKVKITGGEPLLRKDVVEIIQSMPEFSEISMTTNGSFLSRRAYELAEAGLSRVNVSLDTLDDKKYSKITGGGEVKKVIDGIYAAYDAGLLPIKVNMVIMKEINEDEVEDLLNFTSGFNRDGINVILQLIELMKMFGMDKYYVDITPIEEKYSKKARAVVIREMHKRKQYAIDKSVIEFVKPLDNSEFCMHCNRIRVTSNGKVKPCLLRNDNLIDIRNLDKEEMEKAIKDAVMLREPFFCNL
ncbi:MAG TPA: GTP 3',8-cyclase MoaA [Archaeoglobaceae archaeon]|nr:GTP 3',8-cyclase MoaA [Archaeoglobaceae archaeon]